MHMKRTVQQRAARRAFTRQFYHGNMGWFLAAVFSTLMMGALSLVIAWLLQIVIDLTTGSGSIGLADAVLYTLVFLVGFLIFGAAYRITYPRFLRRAVRQYKEYAFQTLTAKGINSFSNESSSRYISALTNDVTVIETKYLKKIFDLIQETVTFFGAFVIMLWYSPILTGATVVLSILPVLASILTGGRLATAEKQVSAQNETFVSTVKDLLAGFPVIKSFRAEVQAQALFSRENKTVEQSKFRREGTEQTISLLSNAAGITTQLGVFLIGAWLALSGRGITPGTVMAFVQLMNYILTPISELPAILAGRRASMALIDKLAQSLQENVRPQGQDIQPRLESGITLRGLSFAYEENAPVLRNVNLQFEAGKSYAIVGGSGSGKTTLLNLLTGGLERYEGEILYDGQELRKISANSLFSLLTMVQQNVFVFNDTIRGNVTMFRDFDQDQVDRAISQAGLTQLIAARGEDYICGENGSGLSGGEKQRISIARALLQGAPVMLMDEATSALDASTAFEITSAILDIQGMTRIVVTHRLEEKLLRRYDAIIVLGGGGVCEQGHFDQLMDRRGLFYALFTLAQAG